MGLMPYIDSLWFGEGLDYDASSSSPPYWLTEISGIPFGLMGDMMGRGHTWRGMVFGAATRFRGADPSPLWRLWDKFGMANASMVGYWEDHPVVSTLCERVLVTAYVRAGEATLLAIASWDPEDRTCALKLEWTDLGLEPAHVRAYAPDLASLGQPGPVEIPLDARDAHAPILRLQAQAGGLIIIERRRGSPPRNGGVVLCGEGSRLLPQCSGLEVEPAAGAPGAAERLDLEK
jgi:hypothetical protein